MFMGSGQPGRPVDSSPLFGSWMLVIRRLVIKNYRSVTDLSLDLNESVVALVGKNGVGKTNLLKAVIQAASACGGESPVLHEPLEPRNYKAPSELEIEFEIAQGVFRYRTRRTYPWWNERGTDVQESLYHDGQLLLTRDNATVTTHGEAGTRSTKVGELGAVAALLQLLPPGDEIWPVLHAVQTFAKSVRYYSLQLRFTETMQDSPLIITASEYQRWKANAARAGTEDLVQMRLIDLSLEQPERFQELLELLGENGLCVISKISVETLRTQESPNAEVTYHVLFYPGPGLAGHGRPFYFHHLSAGTWRIVRILTHWIYDDASTMLLEQPEDSVHFGLVEKLIDLLRNSADRVQLICTTHSAHVVNTIGARGVRLVASKSGVTSARALTADEIESSETYESDSGTLFEYLSEL